MKPKTPSSFSKNRSLPGPLERTIPATKLDLAPLARQHDLLEMKATLEAMLQQVFETFGTRLDQLHRDVQRIGGLTPDFYTCEQLHQIIGGAYCVRTIQNMCADGRIPASKQGRSWLIPAKVVEAWKNDFGLGNCA